MEEMIKVPASRVGFIIGKEGKVKKELQEAFNARLDIDKEGTVIIKGGNGLDVYKMKKAVLGIARGIPLESVLCLSDDDYGLEIINITEIVGKNENSLRRYKARIIGSEGKIKRLIEKKTDTDLGVHGKTVAILGRYDDVDIAKEAVKMILDGSDFMNVSKFLDRAEQEKMSFD